MASKVRIDGTCAKGFEPVKKEFERMLTKGDEANLQLCVYVDQEVVVDLWGSCVGDDNYGPETVQVNNICHN